jgi:hypothetical protein
MALKPVPKLILIAVVVGGVGYALLNTSAWLPKKVEAPKPEPVTVVAPTGPSPSSVQAPPATAPAPALQQAGDTPPLRPTTSDNGLSAVLGAGKK